ncbi:MAG: hypothetical protein IKV47_08385 [Oscillospiraceae bacterium]|nr:hypothetical protein [Oscillospiraceae bacterium]
MKNLFKKIKSVPLRSYLAYLLVVTFVTTGVSFARFGETKTASDGAATAAKFNVSVKSVQSEKLLSVTMDEDGNTTMGNYIFEISSTSEIPITYTISTDTTGAQPLEYGIEMYLTPIYSDSDLTEALAGTHIANQTHVHRPNGSNHVHNFNGNGFLPAGTHTQKFVLNFHYTEDGLAGATQTIKYKVWDDIKIKVTARDGRDAASVRSPSGGLIKTEYTEPYTAE